MTSSPALLAFWTEHRNQMRQSETQRATLTNYILALAAALSGFIVQQDFGSGTWPLALFIGLCGLYGALAAAKYHERANYHLAQARELTRVLVAAGELPDIDTRLDDARLAHNGRFPRLVRLPLHRLWTVLHVAIALYGVILLAVIISR